MEMAEDGDALDAPPLSEPTTNADRRPNPNLSIEQGRGRLAGWCLWKPAAVVGQRERLTTRSTHRQHQKQVSRGVIRHWPIN